MHLGQLAPYKPPLRNEAMWTRRIYSGKHSDIENDCGVWKKEGLVRPSSAQFHTLGHTPACHAMWHVIGLLKSCYSNCILHKSFEAEPVDQSWQAFNHRKKNVHFESRYGLIQTIEGLRTVFVLEEQLLSLTRWSCIGRKFLSPKICCLMKWLHLPKSNFTSHHPTSTNEFIK